MGDVLKFRKPWPHAAAERLSNHALLEVHVRYGDGLPSAGMPPEEVDLAYHNVSHSLDVRDDTERMAAELKLTRRDTSLAIVAASVHNVVQYRPRGGMKRLSADWAINRMRQEGEFAEDDIVAVELAVLGTEAEYSEFGNMLWQRARTQTYPNERARRIALVVACADMAGLYTPQGPALSRKLYKEAQGVGPSDEPPLDGLVEFQDRQLYLLANFRFPHPVGEQLFAGARWQVHEYQSTVMRDLQHRNITTWQQLLESDQDFVAEFQPDAGA